MYDLFNRHINYLRVSVTDRCNMRCIYCMPEGGIATIPHEKILTFEEITEVVSYGAQRGITKVRITGGEPLVRRDIVKLISMLSAIEGIDDLSMTTNGVLLTKYAMDLVEAGLHRINISLDTMDPVRFKEITRVGDLHQVLKGIFAAREAGLAPIKINCVIRENINEPDAEGVAAWCETHGFEARFITWMDLHTGSFSRVIGGDGGHCSICNRLRLTAEGKIKPCLFNDLEFDVRTLGVARAFEEALQHKPSCGSHNTTGEFYNIGG